MAYEVFKRTGVRVEDPTLAITPHGNIVFNAAATRILAAANVRAALLLWDKATSKIAIKATSKSDKNGFAVTLIPGRSGTLKSKSFLSYIGWKGKQRETLPVIWNEREKMMETTLSPRLIEPVFVPDFIAHRRITLEK